MHQGKDKTRRKNWLMFILFTVVPCLLALAAVFVQGCCSHRLYEDKGFESFRNFFNSYPETPGLHKVVKIRNLTVHIVNDNSQFGWDLARKKKNGVVGYSRSPFPDNSINEIWVMGRIVDDQIIFDKAVLGQEFNGVLHFHDKEIKNPDEY